MYKFLEDWKRPGTVAKAVFFIGLILIIAVPVWMGGNRAHPLNWYQTRWCESAGGELSAKMADGTTCDCLTPTHAVEFAFADHWHEAIGQALYNGRQTGKAPGVVLVIEQESDENYFRRLQDTAAHFSLPMAVWPYEEKEPEP